jgi:hypothetical protein
VGEVVAAAGDGGREAGAKLKSAACDGGSYDNSTGKMPVGPTAKMAVLQRSLREFRWKKPEQFSGSTPAIYLQQRDAGL